MKPIEMPSNKTQGLRRELDNDLVQGRQFSFHDNRWRAKVAEGEKQGSLVRSVSKSRRVCTEELLFSGIPSILVTRAESRAGRTAQDTQDQFGVPGPNTHT